MAGRIEKTQKTDTFFPLEVWRNVPEFLLEEVRNVAQFSCLLPEFLKCVALFPIVP